MHPFRAAPMEQAILRKETQPHPIPQGPPAPAARRIPGKPFPIGDRPSAVRAGSHGSPPGGPGGTTPHSSVWTWGTPKSKRPTPQGTRVSGEVGPRRTQPGWEAWRLTSPVTRRRGDAATRREEAKRTVGSRRRVAGSPSRRVAAARLPDEPSGAGPRTYFRRWCRIRLRSFLYLCLRIFLRRFLTTLPIHLPPFPCRGPALA